MSDTCRIQHRHDTDTYNYTELYKKIQIINSVDVSACVVSGVRVRVHASYTHFSSLITCLKMQINTYP